MNISVPNLQILDSRFRCQKQCNVTLCLEQMGTVHLNSVTPILVSVVTYSFGCTDNYVTALRALHYQVICTGLLAYSDKKTVKNLVST